MKKALNLTIIILLVAVAATCQSVVINEFMSDNETTIQDADGDYSDWIELYNRSDMMVNIGGYSITDDTTELDKWIFPEMYLPSGSFLLVFASDKNRTDTTELHTSFKISASGEYLVLCNAELLELDRATPVTLMADKSYGRFPDGEGNFLHLNTPTPAAPNAASMEIEFSEPAGFYTEPFNLTLQESARNYTIYYTLDGSDPDTSSAIFTDSIPIFYKDTTPNTISNIPTNKGFPEGFFKEWTPPTVEIPKANVIRAIAMSNKKPVSGIISASYFVDTNIYEKYNYDVISITTDTANLFNYYTGVYVPGVHWDSLKYVSTGNFFQSGDEWERPANLEYFTREGERVINQMVGLRMHGKSSRNAPEKTLRVYARSEYGKSYFDYPLLLNSDQDKFKRFLLRSVYSDGLETVFKDAMTHDLVKNLNLDLQGYRPVVVFINGEYWGIHSLRDRVDEYYLGLKYDIDPEKIDLLELDSRVIEGSNENYLALLDFIENHDLTDDENYEEVEEWIDVENFIDYQIVEIYFGNADWPGSNIKYWREQKEDAKWRWILFDLDFCYFKYDFDHLSFATYEGDTSYQNPAWSTFMLRNLLKNETFKWQFINRFADLLNTTFQPDTVIGKVNEFESLYQKGMPMNIQRWNFPKSETAWHNSVNWWLRNYANERPCYMRDFILSYFDLEEDEFGFNCNTGIPEYTPSLLSPNPCTTHLKINLQNWNSPEILIEVFDQQGRRVYYKKTAETLEHQDFTLDVSSLNPGFYLLRISGETKYAYEKFIKL